MNVIKPRTLGIVTKICRDPPKAFLSIGVLGFFDFTQMQSFLPDTEMWPFVKGALPDNTPLDAGMPKVCGEVLVLGKAMPKDGVAVSAMAVEFSLGPIRKRAVVFGDRYWQLGAVDLRPTPPKPFVEMPVDYAHAFGGEGYAKNPSGKGFNAARRTRAGELVELPNIEMPERPIVSPADQPEPYGFAPLDIAWPQRSAKAGTFNQHWLRNRYPGAPPDQDPTINNAAPPDQWTQNWFAGDEEFTVSGMHRDYDGYSGRLPGMRARAFIQQTQADGARALMEVALHTETVFLFPSDLRGIVLYRGLVPAADASGRDITDLMIAYERLVDEPRSHPYYGEVFTLRTDPETKGLHAMNDLQLSPALPPEVQAEREAEREEFAAEELAKRQRRSDRQYSAALAKMGLSLNPGVPLPKVQPLPFPIVTPGEIARGEVDVAGIVGAAKRMVGEVQANFANVRARAQAELAAVPGQTQAHAAQGLERAMKGLSEHQAELAARGTPEAQQAAAKVAEVMDSAKTQLTPEALAARAAAPRPEPVSVVRATENLRTQLAQLADQLGGRLGAVTGRAREKLVEAMNLVRGAIALPRGPTAGASPTAGAASAIAGRAGDQMIAALDAAAAHAPADMRPDILAKVAEAKAGWSSAMQQIGVAAASLSSPIATPSLPPSAPPPPDAVADPAHEALDAAVAQAVDKGRRQTRLSSPEPMAPATPLSAEQSQWLRGEAQAAAMSGASLAGRDFAGVDLSGLNFSGLDLTGAMFEQADLTGADFSHATLARAVFTAATVNTARFDYANLQEANFCRVKAAGASLAHVNLIRALLLYGDFAGADLSGARFEQNILIEAKLDKAVLRDSRWEMCGIINTTLPGADFSGAQMRLCSVVKSDLSKAIGRGATLFRVAITDCPADEADFSEATLTRMAAAGGSTFRNALFRRAKANRSSWFKVDLSGTDFNRAELDQAFIGETTAVQASFYRASLRRAVLIGTDFTDADFAEANLFMAILRNATLDRAELRYASLYGAVTDGVSWRLCDLTRANLRLTEFARG